MTLPNKWTNKTLRHLATINYGCDPSAILDDAGEYPVYGTSGSERQGTGYHYEGESIILGRKGSIDRVHFAEGRFWTIDTAYFLSDFDDTVPKWLYYLLCSIDLRALNEATGVPSLSRDLLYKISTPTPPPDEQAKIAEVLSTVDRAIHQTAALIAKQQRIKTGLMQDLLTRGIGEHGELRSEQTHKFKDSPLGRIPVEWDARPLSEVVDLRVGYAFKRAWFADEGVRLLRGENVGTGSADWKDTQWLSSEMADKYPEYMLAEGDIVIGMDRTFTKQGCKVTILGEADVPCLLVQRVGCFMPVRISSDYMQMVIQSAQYQRELLLQQKGMDIPHLSKGEILSPLIPIPKAVEEMESIAGCAKALRTALTNESTHLNTLRLIKTGLMQDLLTGDRRVTALLRSPKEMVGA